MEKKAITEIDISVLPHRSGKVREIYGAGSRLDLLLIVATDRISAFDVVLPTGIPGKGRILNHLSIFWMNFLKGVVLNHLVSSDDEICFGYLEQLSAKQRKDLKGRMMLVRKAEVIPIECVVRDYISGSLWRDYLNQRGEKGPKPYGIPVYDYCFPRDLIESAELPSPLFTPATKAVSSHDINLSYEEMENHLTSWLLEHSEIKALTTAELLAQNLRSTSLTLYLIAREYARKRGIIIADTKFEFGFIDDKLTLIDEVLTPDSSRFWPADSYEPGRSQESFDKQYVRDWLDNIAKWNHEPPAPELPEEVVRKTAEKYKEAYSRLTNGILK